VQTQDFEEAASRRRRRRKDSDSACSSCSAVTSQEDCTACGSDKCSWDGVDCMIGCGTFSSETQCDTASTYCVWYGKKVSSGDGHCAATLDFINLGGTASKNYNGASSQNWMVPGQGRSPQGGLRPQLSTMHHCKGSDCSPHSTAWTACAGETDCWHGVKTDNANRAWDDLEVTLGSTYSKARIDVLIDCEFSGQIQVTYEDLVEADLAVWYNDQKEADTGTNLAFDRRRKSTKIDFAKNDASPNLRMELSSTNTASSNTHSVNVFLYILNVPIWFEKCMDTKATHGQCLEDFVGDDKPLRSDHHLQYKCIDEDGNPQPPIEGCATWHACLMGTDHGISAKMVKAVIEAFDNEATSLLQQNSTSSWSASQGGCSESTCSNPAEIDVESFDCTCYDKVIESGCSDCPKLRSQEEIRNVACPEAQSHICCSWKNTHCPAYPGVQGTLLQKTMSSQESDLLRSRQAALVQGGSLDESLSGKRPCS